MGMGRGNARAIARAIALTVAVAYAGCEPAAPGDDAGSAIDAADVDGGAADAGCANDADCDDHAYCTGAEHCVSGRCSAGTSPCGGGATCDETMDRCVTTCTTDADHDGAIAASCGGDDCDDADATRFPANPEVCDASHDEDCDPLTSGALDADSDGHTSSTCCNGTTCGDDCVDTMPSVYAGATEVCNLVDDDCDSAIDETVTVTIYPDLDGDHYGTGAGAPGCAGTTGTAPSGGDCDDADPARHPGATELCDGIDTDCDGMLDGAGEDVDMDMHAAIACGGDDCVDTDATIHPGVADPCDGTDSDCSWGATDLEDADGDGHVAPADTCTGGLHDDCDDTHGSVHPGATETCNGLDDDCAGGIDDGGAALCAPIPHATAACAGAAGCGIGLCDPEYADCDGLVSGCETALRDDELNCGACGNACGFLCAGLACDDVRSFAAGVDQMCVALASGRVACVGGNARGQCGDGTTTSPRLTPVFASGIADATVVAAGGSPGNEVSCAIRTGGTISCWGDDTFGQLGDGATVSSGGTPRSVMGLSGATTLDIGGAHACARTTAGAVLCWGLSSTGQAGLASGSATAPTTVSGVTGATMIATGDAFSCARLGTTSVVCWGSDGNGQLGDGAASTAGGITPRVVALPAGTVVSLTAGASHACAIVSGSPTRLYCWGDNRAGQIDPAMALTTFASPVAVGTGSATPGSVVAAGATHTCMIDSSMRPWCWGTDDVGQASGGSGGASIRSPAPVGTLVMASLLDVGRALSCTVATGALYCWGDNPAGGCGGGTTSLAGCGVTRVLPP